MHIHWHRYAFLAASLQIITACQTDMLASRMTDVLKLGDTAASAVTLNDTDVKMEAVANIKQMDQQNHVAASSNPYTVRLSKITKPFRNVNGVPLNYKVYLTDDVNAFAMPDGSVRVFSGLMDQMTDDELLFVIGHEIGHVYHGPGVSSPPVSTQHVVFKNKF